MFPSTSANRTPALSNRGIRYSRSSGSRMNRSHLKHSTASTARASTSRIASSYPGRYFPGRAELRHRADPVPYLTEPAFS